MLTQNAGVKSSDLRLPAVSMLPRRVPGIPATTRPGIPFVAEQSLADRCVAKPKNDQPNAGFRFN